MRRLWLLYLLMIFSLASVPGNPKFRVSSLPIDKAAHLLIYGGLAYVFCRPRRPDSGDKRRLFLLGLLLCAATGLSEEFYQGLIPFRTPEFADWVADFIGGASGAGLALILPDASDGMKGRRTS